MFRLEMESKNEMCWKLMRAVNVYIKGATGIRWLSLGSLGHCWWNEDKAKEQSVIFSSPFSIHLNVLWQECNNTDELTHTVRNFVSILYWRVATKTWSAVEKKVYGISFTSSASVPLSSTARLWTHSMMRILHVVRNVTVTIYRSVF